MDGLYGSSFEVTGELTHFEWVTDDGAEMMTVEVRSGDGQVYRFVTEPSPAVFPGHRVTARVTERPQQPMLAVDLRLH